MLQKVRKTMEEFQMCQRGDTLTIGVSGGADSVALLHILWRLSKEEEWQLQVLHVHHGLRGAEADRDAAFVEKLCLDFGISCETIYLNVRKEAEKQRKGIEETARILRYEALERRAAGGKIAVAHHLNDQAETFLMRLCRGTGMQGLSAMRPVRGNLIRPLLFCTRQEIEEYCKKEGLVWQEDSTNFEEIYTRNKIRHQVLPLLETVHEGSTLHLAQTAALLAEENDFFMEEGKKYLERVLLSKNPMTLDRNAILALHPAMQKRVLRMALESVYGSLRNISAAHIADLLSLLKKETGKKINLPKGVQAENAYKTLILAKQKKEKQPSGFSYVLPQNGQTVIPEAGVLVETSLSTEKNVVFSADDYTNVFDYDKIKQVLCCRSRKQGDRIYLKEGSKKLKDYFIDRKIPRQERDLALLVATGSQVIWILGRYVSPFYLANDETKQFLSVQVRRLYKDEGKN